MVLEPERTPYGGSGSSLSQRRLICFCTLFPCGEKRKRCTCVELPADTASSRQSIYVSVGLPSSSMEAYVKSGGRGRCRSPGRKLSGVAAGE
ncbi:hypothetical protein NDU88_008581 [Pleurodeles waltl]|uniref:Uncharacterized protein n=1 Tax=Pleurodeles waltl TaxID=8319 RepID=A0AAV7NZD6_PLEWA|nr:hypothetical protein NDU88_008581 [Pleurodeles waltl]